MEEKVFVQKKKLLKRVSREIYYGLINYIGWIYNNSDYDAIVLMARKFSNLYTALLPLVRTEYFGIIEEEHQEKEKGTKQPLIISDRAIDIILNDIRIKKEKTRYKRILISDDVIIHGTTIKTLRDKLLEEFQAVGVSDYKVDIVAYAKNQDKFLISEGMIKEDEMEKYTIGSWREISGKIIDVLYLMGQSYTSYVPNARIPMQSVAGHRIEEYIKKGYMREITDPGMRRNDVRAYADVICGDENFTWGETYRIYEFSVSGEYVFVPMVCLKPATEDILNKCISKFQICISQDKHEIINHILENCSGKYKYRMMEYVLSALSGWKFWVNSLKLNLEVCRFDEEEEELNFGFSYLQIPDEISNIEALWREMQNVYSDSNIENSAILSDGSDMQKMSEELMQLIEEVKKAVVEDKREVAKDIIGKLLQRNGDFDEARLSNINLNNGDKVQRRIPGIALTKIFSEMERIDIGIQEVLCAILAAIDFGRGSIVPYVGSSENQKVYFAVLHAGEQNYKYYLDKYLPFMYGAYILEQKIQGDLSREKEELWLLYNQCRAENGEIIFKNDKEQLLSMSIQSEYEDVVINAALQNRNDTKLKYIIEKTKEIINDRMKQ